MYLLAVLLLAAIPLQGKICPDQEPNDLIGHERELLGPMKWVEKVTLSEAVYELCQGIADPVFDESFLSRIKAFEKSNPEGEYLELWPNGKTKFRGFCRHGKANSHLHGWYEDGTDAFKGFYHEGTRVGIHIAWYHPSVRRSPNSFGRILSYDEKGRLFGEQLTFYPYGNLRSFARFKDGKLQGKAVVWNKENKMTLYQEYKNDKPIKVKNQEKEIQGQGKATSHSLSQNGSSL